MVQPHAVRLLEEVLDAQTASFSNEVGEYGFERGIGRVGIVGVLDVRQLCVAFRAGTYLRAGAAEGIAQELSTGDEDASGLQVGGRGGERSPQIGLRAHVANGVVNDDRREGAAQAHIAHIAHEVLDAGIQPPGVREHVLGEVERSGLEVGRPVRQVVPAADAKLQNIVAAAAQRLAQPSASRSAARQGAASSAYCSGGLITGQRSARSW